MLGRLKRGTGVAIWDCLLDTDLKRGHQTYIEQHGGETLHNSSQHPVVVWKPSQLPPVWKDATWFYYVWCRVNLPTNNYPKDKFHTERFNRFIYKAHTRVIAYLENFPLDADIDENYLVSLYIQLGPSRFPDDEVQVTFETVKLKRTPLEVIREAHPKMKWTPEEMSLEDLRIGNHREHEYIDGEWAPVVEVVPHAHVIYLSVIQILNQCQATMDMHREHGGPVFDALWAYYASWMPFFEYATRPDADVSDEGLFTPGNNSLCPWDLYGTLDTRAFHAGDLPDLFHVLVSIPLWGEQNAPPYTIGKILQKCLPFACQRRQLIKLIDKTVQTDHAFWRLFSKLFWVALAGLYPGKLAATKNKMGMRELLRIKELTDSKEKLMSALTKDQPKYGGGNGTNNGGPLIMFTPFRLYVLYMASFNPHYVQMARLCVNWDYFETDAIELIEVIRGQNLFPDDPFAQSRKKLSKTAKSPSSKVHRFRRKSKAVSITEQMNTTLEKTVLKDMQDKMADLEVLSQLNPSTDPDWREKFRTTFIGKKCNEPYTEEDFFLALEVCRKAQPFYSTLVKVPVKSAILNALLNIPQEKRLSYSSFCILSLPEYGGISPESVQLMVELVRVYHEKAVPKEFARYINMFNAKDFMICCYYYNIVSLLEKISFVTLDAETTRRIDYAMMTKKHALYPGQTVPDNMYNVSIALCCERICTIMGMGKYGDQEVAYDTERQMFVCVHGKQIKKKEQEGGEEEEGEDDDDSDSLDDSDDDGGKNKEYEPNVADLMVSTEQPAIDIEKLLMGDLVAQSVAMKGKGVKRSKEMIARKMVRNQRKAFSKIPCGQPVISVSLRGRALVWGNTLENKIRYMFCPQCASLHVYSVLNYAGGDQYRCPECARKELYHVEHLKCAYCQKASPQVKKTLEVFCPMDANGDYFQRLPFCKGHYSIARRYAYKNVPKDIMWKLIAEEQTKRNIATASGRWIKK